MEKRIKVVWILTLVTAFLMIGGQAYWLYTQYCYSVNEYMRNLHEQILKMEKEESGQRYAMTEAERHMQLNCCMQLPDSANPKGETEWKITFFVPLNSGFNADSVFHKGRGIYIDNILIEDTFEVSGLSSEQVFDVTSRYRAELSVPFTANRFDSLLRSGHVEPEDLELAVTDSIQWAGSYTKSDRLFPPAMEIIYPYNPLSKQVAKAIIRIPLNPLIREMGWQLLGSCCLLVLLVFCLVYQIKTILEQRKIDEMRKNFVNTMIHELKRPVQTLKMCISFLNNKRMRHDEQVMDEVVQDAMFELDNLSAYLAKVRNMTRADYENTPLNIRTFNLEETVRKIIRLSNIPPGKEVTVIPRFELDSPLVTADPVHVANIISNLIENAVKYSGEVVLIRVDCCLRNHNLLLRVEDNGIGIAAADQPRVFDKFYRANNLPDRNIPGIGLGLSYVKLLTEAHRGTIHLESHPGKGSVFTIQIPQ